MSSVVSVSDKNTLKYIGVGVTVFFAGGLASYALIQFFCARRTTTGGDENMLQQVNGLKHEIVALKDSLSNAVNDLRKELDGIRQAVGSKRKLRSRSGRSLTSMRTAGSYETAWSDYDDMSDDEFDVPPDTMAPVGVSDVQPRPGSIEELEAICTKVDALNEGNDEDREEAMRILQDNELNVNHKNSWQLLWRLSRSHIGAYDTRDAYDERCLHATSGVEYAQQALELNDDSADVHKWYAISLGASTDFVPTKEKIEVGYKIKEHIDRALELNETDPTLHFMKGRWCWGVYMLSWIERKLAATLFAVPPTATVNDALECFQKAEDLDPGFYKANRYYLAKCYYQKSNYMMAKEWLESAHTLPCNSKEDRETQKEVEQLLEKL